jgi:hypothetical protein
MQFTKVALSVLFLLVFIPLFADGQTKPPASAFANVSGRIVNSADGKPFKDSYAWILKATGEFHEVVKTDKTGHYEVSVPKGSYYIVLGSSGYLPAVRSVFLDSGQAYYFSSKLKIDMKEWIFEQP